MCSIDRKVNWSGQDMLYLHQDTYHMLRAVSCSPALRATDAGPAPPSHSASWSLFGNFYVHHCIRQLPTLWVVGNFLRYHGRQLRGRQLPTHPTWQRAVTWSSLSSIFCHKLSHFLRPFPSSLFLLLYHDSWARIDFLTWSYLDPSMKLTFIDGLSTGEKSNAWNTPSRSYQRAKVPLFLEVQQVSDQYHFAILQRTLKYSSTISGQLGWNIP